MNDRRALVNGLMKCVRDQKIVQPGPTQGPSGPKSITFLIWVSNSENVGKLVCFGNFR